MIHLKRDVPVVVAGAIDAETGKPIKSVFYELFKENSNT
jgi:hypothetical protein